MTPDHRDHLLFVDDEKYFAKNYVRALEKQFKVTLKTSALEGLSELQTHKEIKCFVLDIMMPTPKGVGNYETRNGNNTGIWFLRAFRRDLIKSGIPIVILTNRNVDEIRGLLIDAKYPISQLSIYHKPMTAFLEFAGKVAKIVQNASETGIEHESKSGYHR